MDYYHKYIKYKYKYNLLKQQGGVFRCLTYGLQQHLGECWHDSLTMMMMQSDVTKDDFYEGVKNFSEVKFEFKDEESYLLPSIVYIWYRINGDDDKTKLLKINSAMEISIDYIKNQIKRILNRDKNDEILQRYPVKSSMTPDEIKKYNTQLLMSTEGLHANINTNIAQQTEKDIEEIKNTERTEPNKTKLKRQLSLRTSISCSISINKLINLINGTNKLPIKFLSHGGTTDSIITACDILNYYLLRPSNPHIFLLYEICTLNEDLSDVNNNIMYNKLIKLIDDENFIGINISHKVLEYGLHATTVYTCGGEELYYDDNNEKPKQLKWKELFKNILLRKLNDNDITEYIETLIGKNNIIEELIFITKTTFENQEQYNKYLNEKYKLEL